MRNLSARSLNYIIPANPPTTDVLSGVTKHDYLTPRGPLVDFIELLPPTMIVDRISGDAPPDYFIGPSWCLDKPAVKAAVLTEFARRGTWQGKSHLSVGS